MNCRIPKLTLQPILENSIIHGTELKIGEGNLWIRFRRTENRLVITISDDGVGIDEATLERLNANAEPRCRCDHAAAGGEAGRDRAGKRQRPDPSDFWG